MQTFIRHCRSIFIACLSFFFALPCVAVTAGKLKPAESLQVMEIRIESKLLKDLQMRHDVLEQRYMGELQEHRAYLERLDNKIYSNFTGWLTAGFFVSMGLFAFFLYYTGRSKKEAIEAVKLSVMQKLQNEVKKFIEQDNVLEVMRVTIDARTKDFESEIDDYAKRLIESIKRELTDAMEDTINNLRTVLDDATRDISIAKRMEEIEKQLTIMKNTINEREGDSQRS